MTKQLMSLAALLAVTLFVSQAEAGRQSTEWALKMFEENSHNFGVVARGSDVRHRIKITNIYEENVHISDVKTSCGCTAAKPSVNSLASLEEAYVEIVMDTKKFTRQKDSTVIITFDAPNFAEVRIPISAYIRTDVVTEPGSLNFGNIDMGDTSTQKMSISYAGRSDWTIRGMENLPEYMEADLKELSRTSTGVNYELIVNLKENAPVGPFRGQVSLVTDDEANPRVPLLVEGEVVPDIVVNPPVISFGMLTPGQKMTKNIVIRGKKPFTIEKVECETDLKAFEVQMPEEAKMVHVLPLTISTPEGNGNLVEEFTVTIAGRKEPVVFKAFCKVEAGS